MKWLIYYIQGLDDNLKNKRPVNVEEGMLCVTCKNGRSSILFTHLPIHPHSHQAPLSLANLHIRSSTSSPSTHLSACLSTPLSIHPSIHPSCYLQFWLSGSYTHICVQYQRIKRWGYLCIFLCLLFYPGLSEFTTIGSTSLPCSLPQPPDSLKFLHSIFSVEIKPPAIPNAQSPSCYESTFNGQCRVSVSPTCSLCFCYQAGGWVRWLPMWRGVTFREGAFYRGGGPLSSETSPLADSISGLKQRVSRYLQWFEANCTPCCVPILPWDLGLVFMF